MEIGHGQGGDGGTETSTAGAGAGSDEEDGGQPSGGTAGQSGSGGSTIVGGPIPKDDGPQQEVGKVDLLLAIDNSLSMAEKQRLFADALPELVERLVNPRCVDDAGNVVSAPASPSAACPSGSRRELKPLRDLHIGAITSSLGSHGASGAGDVCTRAGDDDHAYLLPFVRNDVPSYDDQGYLKWDPDGLSNPPGESDAQQLADAVRVMVQSAGESGCGFESQLESVYRFLVDPEPYQTVTLDAAGSRSEKVGVDEELLRQRAAFLRPDSSVVVLMLTDENDCSIMDESYGWLISRSNGSGVPPMFRSTSQCQVDPNDTCCQSCGEIVEHAGCPAMQADAECLKGKTLPLEDDSLNLRCFEQKRRFGFDLLYPTARYVSGFGGGTVLDRSGALVQNPLFHSGGLTRDPSLFTFALVGGMPWQDVATTDSLSSETLQLLTPTQLESQKRWPLLIGNVASNVPPQDPFMRESIDERSGTNPLTGEDIVPGSSQDPSANSINGHEHETFATDLQYACTFDLPAPIECSSEAQAADVACDCYPDDLERNRPLCNPPGGGAPTTLQYKGKAYPALRELRVARELGRRTVLGSVCSRNTSDDARTDYGYRPIFSAIGERVAATLEKP
ncbi:MAG: hypothetical protein EOO73_08015 [Myxococcales bacterium]|nr:MAG: hypothetical protein EOO73_08015 [Myxococcales bacterium]